MGQRTGIATTHLFAPCQSVFTSSTLGSDPRTVLLPQFGAFGHFIVLLIAGRTEDLGYLPGGPYQSIVLVDSIRIEVMFIGVVL